MLHRARANAEKAGLKNAFFVESSITHIAVETPDVPCLSSSLSSSSSSSSSSSAALGPVVADCIISNCVVSLVPEDDKQKVFDEMFRLLRPGGRVAISDLLAKRDMPEHMRRDMSLYAACIGGASTVGRYDSYLRKAGFGGSCSVLCSHRHLLSTEARDTVPPWERSTVLVPYLPLTGDGPLRNQMF